MGKFWGGIPTMLFSLKKPSDVWQVSDYAYETSHNKTPILSYLFKLFFELITIKNY